ncbi:right-handed parallel beta-helix repeat-containing protein [Cellulosimicrobium cellulans]|uniref:NosD domain-containing protein n=1 Tax=Cellulosimicrobium cellulans TaxID=1710 RepID=UPI001964E714|nr:right-handed parallel beta-helix repeat-containing protein [Cellulosimicrobium cellulans]MBN0040255.1 right-handed parallel beta-helix repeat-containing protein [Cellulosimicrobium cellulans]
MGFIWVDGVTPLSAANLNELLQLADAPAVVADGIDEAIVSGALVEPINLAVAITGGTFNVLAYGAVANGATDCTNAFQDTVNAAAAAGGGVVYVPSGTYYLSGVVQLADDITVRGDGDTTVLSKRGAVSSGVIFQGASGSAQGYGAGPSRVVLERFRAVGSYAAAQTGCVAQLHHCRDVVVRDVVVDELIGGGHAFDLMGCDTVTFSRCTFLGVDGSRIFTEAIQTDFSQARGFTIADDPAGCDGLATINVTVDGCSFLPKVVGGTSYYAPNPMGTHTGVEGSRPSGYRFTNNLVRGWQGDLTSAYAGALHFAVGVDGLDIDGNVFENSGGQAGLAINLYRGAYLLPMDQVQNPNPPAAPESANPLVPLNTRITRNTFTGWTNAGVDAVNAIVQVQGDQRAGFPRADNVIIADNAFPTAGSGVATAPASYPVHVRYATRVRVTGNSTRYASKGIWVRDASQITITGNVVADSTTTATDGGGIRCTAVDDLTCTGNTLTAVKDPLWFNACNRATISGNAAQALAGSSYGIYYTTSASVATITGNVVTSTGTVTRGIYISNGANNVVATGNTIVGAFTNPGVTTSGSTNVVVPAGSNATGT